MPEKIKTFKRRFCFWSFFGAQYSKDYTDSSFPLMDRFNTTVCHFNLKKNSSRSRFNKSSILRKKRRYFVTQFLKQNFAGRLRGQIEFSHKLESDWWQRCATKAIKFTEFTMTNLQCLLMRFPAFEGKIGCFKHVRVFFFCNIRSSSTQLCIVRWSPKI